MKQCPHCGEMRPHGTEEDEKRRRERKEKEVRISAFNRYRSRHRFTSNWFSWIDLFKVTRSKTTTNS